MVDLSKKDETGALNLLKRPYMERRLIVVSNKAVLEAAKADRTNEADSQSDSIIGSLAFSKSALKLAERFLTNDFSLGTIL